VERGFGCEVDYGSFVKTFSHSDLEEQRRYSPPDVMSVKRNPIKGNPVVNFHEPPRETEPHIANALSPPHAINQCSLQKVGKLQSSGCLALRLLQFREIRHRNSMHTRNGPLALQTRCGQSVISLRWLKRDRANCEHQVRCGKKRRGRCATRHLNARHRGI
jgi:hypothetical protein